MKLYVSAPSGVPENNCSAAILMALCQKYGHTITHNWTNNFGMGPLSFAAKAEIDGVVDCDMLLVYAMHGVSSGMWAEIGAALGARKPVIWIGKKAHAGYHSFESHPLIVYEYDSLIDFLNAVEEKNDTKV